MIPVTSLHSGVSSQSVLILNTAKNGRFLSVVQLQPSDREVLVAVPLAETYNSGLSDIFWSAVDITESSCRTAVYSSWVSVSNSDNSVNAFNLSGSGLLDVFVISA